MNNIYVSELPKDCLDCPCRNSEFMHCNLIYCDHSIGYFNEDELDYKYVPINQDFEELICPLKQLSDRLAEERKRVIWEIRKRAKRTRFYIKITEKSPTAKEKCFVYEVSDDLLDQIERGE